MFYYIRPRLRGQLGLPNLFRPAYYHLLFRMFYFVAATNSSVQTNKAGVCAGNTKRGSIAVLLTSCLTGLEPAV